MPQAPPQPKLKLLCLHGYAQNGQFFRERTGAVRKQLKSVCEFTFLDAPRPATGEFLGQIDEATRGAITQRFWEYNGMCRERLWSKFGAHQHWAKIELPDDAAAAAAVRRRLAERFPVDAFNRARRTLDPHNILANDLVDSLLGDPREEAYAKRGG